MLRAALLALALGAAPALAQEDAPNSAILTIVPDRLLVETMAGRAVTQRFEARSRALVTENRTIEAALEAEERDLTSRRAVTDPQDFSRLAAEFDTKVDGIRDRQDQKSRELTRVRDIERKAFLEASMPVFSTLMREMGAVAILDRGSVFLSFDLIDVTDQAIDAIDEKLGDGTSLFDAPPPEPTP